jgi:hypothetical protein
LKQVPPSSGGNVEQLSINVQAVPSLETFGRFVESGSPFMFGAQAVQKPAQAVRAAFAGLRKIFMSLVDLERRSSPITSRQPPVASASQAYAVRNIRPAETRQGSNTSREPTVYNSPVTV